MKIKLSKDGKDFSNNFTQTHNSFDWSTNKKKLWWRNNKKNTTNDGVVEANHVKIQIQPL